MIKTVLFTLLFLLPVSSFAQMGSSVGTLNQIHKDPAEQEVENELDDLRKTVNDLDKPKIKAKTSKEREDIRESQLPSAKRQQNL